MSTISAVLGRRVQLKGLIGKRAMKCPYCDFYFMKNGSDLQRHIWAHEGECSPSGAERLLLACFAWERVRGRRGLGAPAGGLESVLRAVCPPTGHTDRSVPFLKALVAVGVKQTSVTPDLKSKCQEHRASAVSHGGDAGAQGRARRVAGAGRVAGSGRCGRAERCDPRSLGHAWLPGRRAAGRVSRGGAEHAAVRP